MKKILTKALDGKSITADEAKILFSATSQEDILSIKSTADKIRQRLVGDDVCYIVNLNMNFTNICQAHCLFCGFRRNKNDEDSYIIELDEFEKKLEQHKKEGITEICFQGGLYPELEIKGLGAENLLETYGKLLSWTKKRLPDVHLHSYSPEEIDMLSTLSGQTIDYVLDYLKDCGLDSMPGTAAEILVDSVRKKICPAKLNANRWVEIIKTAHRLGIPSTATILYGHVETNSDRVKHLDVLRELQRETGGFTEFIHLPFVPFKTRLKEKVTPLTGIDRLKMLAIARIFFQHEIPNIQASWVKQGLEETAEALDWGVNDVGGTLSDEKITLCAGGNFGSRMDAKTLVELIQSKNKNPVLRDTLYKTPDCHDSHTN